MLEIPTSFYTRTYAGAGGGDPTEVFARFRFFNDSNDMADVEAYGSQAGMNYEPVAVQPAVVPHSARESYKQFPSIPDLRHVMVIIHRNSAPLGPFYLVNPLKNIEVIEATMEVNPANQDVTIELCGWDEDGLPIDPVIFPPPIP